MNLRTTLGTILIIGSLSGLAGCATTPDPAEVCTAEWVQPRAALAIKELRRDTGRTIKSLARNAEKRPVMTRRFCATVLSVTLMISKRPKR